MLAPGRCDWGRLGATGEAGVLMTSFGRVSGARCSGGGTASKSESWLVAGEVESFIEVA